MTRILLVASIAFGALFATACHKRCESGFISQGGVCVSYMGVDAGMTVTPPRDGGVEEPVRDGGFDPTRDAGPPRDAGPRRDAGGGVVDGGPVTFGRILIRAGAVLPMTSDEIIEPGEVLVVDDTIECVGGRGICDATNATIVETSGVLVPGLVDAHNHVAYDWLPEWEPGRLWDDHSQWQANSAYRDFVQAYSMNSGILEHLCAMVQWGELRALVNGVTTIFGTPQPRVCYRWLIRNAELSSGYTGWDADRMRSNTLGIDTVDQGEADALVMDMQMGEVTAYMIHLAEGLSTRARDEYVDLVALGLLRPETVIIHGTALTAADFIDVGNAGAKVVWSPSSNFELYGDTTDISAAVMAGVSVSIAPDWTPSGADDVLHELRYAKTVAETRWPGLFTDADYLAMSTVVPANQMAVDTWVGTIEIGKYADLVVLDVDPTTPYASVLEARPGDIRLVLLNGVPSYGDPAILGAMIETPGDCYDLDACGTAKQACWAQPPDNNAVSPDSIASVIGGFYPPGPQDLFDCR